MRHGARVAVVGSGPAGVYAAQALVATETPISVDVLDRLPTPYGLVRYGVAPDHLKIKSIANTLARTLEEPGVRFLGNVTYGRDIGLADLRECYDAVVFATGAEQARDLGIPGEELPGSIAATDFVAWYNGHPDAGVDPPLPRDARAVAVIGAGNVAIDVARVLLRDRHELAGTDIPDHVLAALSETEVTDVYMLARRGPENAKFTPAELRALGELTDVDVLVRDVDLPPAEDADEASPPKRPRDNVGILRSWGHRQPTEASHRIHFRFFHRPARILGEERVTTLHCDSTGDGPADPLPVQAVIRAVGYRAVRLPDLPFDSESSTVPHQDGRVIDHTGEPVPGTYVAGWIKRGPTGVIGTNKSDASATIASLLEDLPRLPGAGSDDPDAITRLLDQRGVRYVTWDGWKRLDEYELRLGDGRERPRGKVSDLNRLLAIADGHVPHREERRAARYSFSSPGRHAW